MELESVPTVSVRTTAPALLDAYTAVRRTTESLCAPVSAEDCTVQSMPDASPLKWHLAHTSWFFETFVLARAESGLLRGSFRPHHPQFGFLFNSYYEGAGGRIARAERGLLTRPSLAEVLRYREHVDRGVRSLFDDARDVSALAPVVTLGLHHEMQHQELILTDLKHLFSRNPLRPAYSSSEPPTSPSRPDRERANARDFVAHPAGVRSIGHASSEFAFDNEMPRHDVYCNAFELAARPVTNGEYVAFIEDGGYARPTLWLSDGWAAVQQLGWSAPAYWERDGEGWNVFTLSGMRKLDPHEPVAHVSYFEADAFARWAGARLPRESEWEVAAAGLPIEGNLLESGALHPRPVGRDAAGHAAMFGDVWEWTQSAYSPYPGYREIEGVLGEYNGKFMCSQMVLRGGSCASPRAHVRATYRNFFPPTARWQFSGVRLARDV
jgi:ergothioneine biosynthesis protein EgtB